MPTISPISLVRNGECDDAPPTLEDLRAAQRAFHDAVQLVDERARSDGDLSFRELERELRQVAFAWAVRWSCCSWPCASAAPLL